MMSTAPQLTELLEPAQSKNAEPNNDHELVVKRSKRLITPKRTE